jgi:hypothetical protein
MLRVEMLLSLRSLRCCDFKNVAVLHCRMASSCDLWNQFLVSTIATLLEKKCLPPNRSNQERQVTVPQYHSDDGLSQFIFNAPASGTHDD